MSYCGTCGSKLNHGGSCPKCCKWNWATFAAVVILIAAVLFGIGVRGAAAQGNATSLCIWSVRADGGQSCVPVSATAGLPVSAAGNAFVNIPTNTNTVVKTGAGVVNRLTVNTAGTTSSVVIYDGATCTGTIVGTYSTTAQGSVEINAAVGTGICATTAGGAAADVTITYQ